jgi:hypothetical protein
MKIVLPIPVFLLGAFTCFSVALAGAAESTSSPTEVSTSGTPSEVWHTYVEAIKGQNVAVFKSTLASAELEKMEQSTGNITAETLKSMAAEGAPPTETRNEQIRGDTATLEVKWPDHWEPISFHKEDGNWKVVLSGEGAAVATDKPSDTWRAYLEAVKTRDVEAFKRSIAQRILEKFEQSVDSKKESLPQALKSMAAEMPQEPFETRNEKISADGETANLEVKDTTRSNHWVRVYFVKGEDGAWKLTFMEDQIGELVPGELVP